MPTVINSRDNFNCRPRMNDFAYKRQGIHLWQQFTTPHPHFFTTPYPQTPYPPLNYIPSPSPTFHFPAQFPYNGHALPAHVHFARRRDDLDMETGASQSSSDSLTIVRPTEEQESKKESISKDEITWFLWGSSIRNIKCKVIKQFIKISFYHKTLHCLAISEWSQILRR